jgi:predicted nucleic acid-binding protein
MSLVVADTSPLNYLILISETGVLPALFTTVFVPPAVAAELNHPKASEKVRQWIAAPPQWIQQRQPLSVLETAGLGAGERQAIALAEEIRADTVLIDDGAARRFASNRGLRVLGVVGLLELAASEGLCDLAACFARLQQTNFRVDRNLLAEVLEAHAKRNRK